MEATLAGPDPLFAGAARRVLVSLTVNPAAPWQASLLAARITDEVTFGGADLSEVLDLGLLRHGGQAEWRRELRRYRAR